MKKWGLILVGALLLSGCSKAPEQLENLTVTSYHDDYFKTAISEWQKCISAIRSIGEEEQKQIDTLYANGYIDEYKEIDYEKYNRNDYNIMPYEDLNVLRSIETSDAYETGELLQTGRMTGYIHIRNIDTEFGKEVIASLEEYIGDELTSFIEAVRTNTEEIVTVDTVIGNYGIGAAKRLDGIALYVCHQSIVVQNEEVKALMDQIQEGPFLVGGISVGEEGYLVELTTPLMYMRQDGRADIYQNAVYYHVLVNPENEVTKLRMVINQGYKEQNLDKAYLDKAYYSILDQVAAKWGEVDQSHIKDAVERALTKEKTKSSGTTQLLKYSVNTYEYSGIEHIIELTVEPK